MKTKHYKFTFINHFAGIFKDIRKGGKHFGRSQDAMWFQFWIKDTCIYFRIPTRRR